MSFLKYLRDNIRFFLFYVLLMVFIILMVMMDRNNRMLSSNINYMIAVSSAMFICYVFIDYFLKCSHIKKLINEEKSEDKIPILPKPQDTKDEVYCEIIQNLYSYYMDSIKVIKSDFKENQDFMTAWVHEIKTPITTTKLLLESSKENGETLNSIGEEIGKIDDYVEKVLYYSRCSDFSKDYIISEENVKRLVNQSIKKHSILFIRKRIKPEVNISDDFIVDTDKKWLLFIIDQIVSNALKYTKDNGCITFETKADSTEKVLIIKDNGAGIKSEDLKRIFDKFYSGYNGRNKNLKATGLGLYLSRKLAKKLGHSITIDSKYGVGTSVYIHFPVWDDYYNVTNM